MPHSWIAFIELFYADKGDNLGKILILATAWKEKYNLDKSVFYVVRMMDGNKKNIVAGWLDA